mmetsp:Transcript_31754/g.91247  ORF Transcript_31754/g.91247 Transcript_31754/m.91247 type:complete len:314 (-) Transcript_31754:67-1008(-)
MSCWQKLRFGRATDRRPRTYRNASRRGIWQRDTSHARTMEVLLDAPTMQCTRTPPPAACPASMNSRAPGKCFLMSAAFVSVTETTLYVRDFLNLQGTRSQQFSTCVTPSSRSTAKFPADRLPPRKSQPSLTSDASFSACFSANVRGPPALFRPGATGPAGGSGNVSTLEGTHAAAASTVAASPSTASPTGELTSMKNARPEEPMPSASREAESISSLKSWATTDSTPSAAAQHCLNSANVLSMGTSRMTRDCGLPASPTHANSTSAEVLSSSLSPPVVTISCVDGAGGPSGSPWSSIPSSLSRPPCPSVTSTP